MKKDTQTESTELATRKEYDMSIDNLLTSICLDRKLGEVVKNRENAVTARAYTVNSMVFNAIFEMDVELIKTIAMRVDGTVPAEGERSGYANLLGDAINDVMGYEDSRMLTITPDDLPIIAMAKVLAYKATQPAGTNYQQRKERNLAAQMILERTGGRKVSPTRPLLETKYVEPDWMEDE